MSAKTKTAEEVAREFAAAAEALAKHLAALPPGPYRTGTGDHYSREVRGADGDGFAWCGGSNGREEAKAIVEILNAARAVLGKGGG